ncbi:DUF3843 family protein [Bacteroides stercorirosoris]|uniref:DUF3843 family protein n=1 Tax=Bacteroides stercorirosoris TaxID=871324 RepID=A0A1M6CBA4_9BACE|nr:DUF3843 family protein [Bacteroides stercorirosoris]SHI58276.1 Protein of unknown function [Bacteroides stercorirosoris]
MKIIGSEWRLGHWFAVASASDTYYVKLANRIRDYIRFADLNDLLTDFEQHNLAKLITFYFEDVISDVGIWRAFVTAHKEMYGKYLPFYNVDESQYYADEINLEDICFLIWMGVQQYQKGVFINPENPGLMQLADKLYALLDKEFENAPINTELVEKMYKSEWFEDFYLLKDWCAQFYRSAYLLQDEREWDHQDEVDEEFSEMLEDDNVRDYAVASYLAINSKIGPLALTVPEWAQYILKSKGMNREAELLAGIKCLPYNLYLLKEHDADVLVVESLDGTVYTVDRSSMDSLQDDILEKHNALLTSLAFYDSDNWQVCGITSWVESSEVFYKMREEQEEEKASDRELYDKLLQVTGNYPLIYFAGCEDLMQWLGKHIGFSPDFVPTERMENGRNIAVFILPDGQLSILPDGALYIKDERNPYYNPEQAKRQALKVIVEPSMTSKEMLYYLLERQMLPDAQINSLQGSERGRQLIQENIDFVARFSRRYKY